MYKERLEDFVTIEHNALGRDPNEIISICKRFSNKKRDFLFVNKIQAKHIPTKYKDFANLTVKLYNCIEKSFHPHGNILIIGFAETATALSSAIMHQACLDTNHANDHIWYVQTTRHHLNRDYITFSEEHSHATEQRLYLNTMIPADTIIMIDDEITTGKTIINMVDKLKKFYPNANYHCASVLNWQNEENKKCFSGNNITSTALVTGCIKDNLYTIDITAEEPINITFDKTDDKNKNYNTLFQMSLFTGIYCDAFMRYIRQIRQSCNLLKSFLNVNNEKFLIIGTEECMYPAILLSSFFKNAVCQSTTRSPITVNSEDRYAITSGNKMLSNYGNYVTYLYDVPKDTYNRLLVVTDCITKHLYEQAYMLAELNNIPRVNIIGY